MITIQDYINLVPSQHRDKPNFIATLSALIQPFVDLQNIDFGTAFDIDFAIGKQLDIIGEWVGVSRRISTPITGVYFAWNDTELDGWNSGVWKGKFDPTSGLQDLPDDSYRTLLKAKIAANKWDGTIENAYAIWKEVFVNSFIIIEDLQDMSINIGVAGQRINAVELALLTEGYIPLKPMGVKVNYYVIANNGGALFGWNIQNEAVNGWGIGSWAKKI